VLECLTPNFRLLLRLFDGDTCPLCGVVKWREARDLEQLRVDGISVARLCGHHLEIVLSAIIEPIQRAWRTRQVLESSLAQVDSCVVCTKLLHIESRLVRAIRRLDGSMRFQKALERAPVFCRKHAKAVAGENDAIDFAQTQKAKVVLLRDGIAQAELRNSEELEGLMAQALAYLSLRLERVSVTEVQKLVTDLDGCADEETAEFARWEDARLLQHVSALESEVAALRYRNAVLSEEDRRLKLAYTANEAIRRDLERDREQLLAAARESRPNPLKSSNQH
jgi:hypothetical protein